MLQNAYFLAKIGADTAENEQHLADILPKTGNYPTTLRVSSRAKACMGGMVLPPGRRRSETAPLEPLAEAARPGGSVREERANFTGLVLGCIEAKFFKKKLM